MSILPDHELARLLSTPVSGFNIYSVDDKGVIDYRVKERTLDYPSIRPASVDVHLGPMLHVYHNQAAYYWDLRLHELELVRGMFVLGATQEYVNMGPEYAADIVGLSSVARRGGIVESAGFIDPGFKGQLTLELSNRSPVSLPLYLGMRIAQIRVYRLDSPSVSPYNLRNDSHYQSSIGPIEARGD